MLDCPGPFVLTKPSHRLTTSNSPSGSERNVKLPSSCTASQACHCGGFSCGFDPCGQTWATTRPCFTGRGTESSSLPRTTAPRLRCATSSFVWPVTAVIETTSLNQAAPAESNCTARTECGPAPSRCVTITPGAGRLQKSVSSDV